MLKVVWNQRHSNFLNETARHAHQLGQIWKEKNTNCKLEYGKTGNFRHCWWRVFWLYQVKLSICIHVTQESLSGHIPEESAIGTVGNGEEFHCGFGIVRS